MNTQKKGSHGLTIVLVLAVVATLPLAGSLVLLFRAAGLLLVIAALGGAGVALAISPSFRETVRSQLANETEAIPSPQIGGSR